MAQDRDISPVDREAQWIADALEQEAQAVAKTLFPVPPGLERMRSTREAMERFKAMTPEQRRAFLMQNPDATDIIVAELGRNGGGNVGAGP